MSITQLNQVVDMWQKWGCDIWEVPDKMRVFVVVACEGSSGEQSWRRRGAERLELLVRGGKGVEMGGAQGAQPSAQLLRARDARGEGAGACGARRRVLCGARRRVLRVEHL